MAGKGNQLREQEEKMRETLLKSFEERPEKGKGKGNSALEPTKVLTKMTQQKRFWLREAVYIAQGDWSR